MTPDKVPTALFRLAVLAVFLLGMIVAGLYSARAEARDVAEIPGVAVLTDNETIECGTGWREARDPANIHGCWTMDEHTREITVEFPDREPIKYSDIRFEIYGRLL